MLKAFDTLLQITVSANDANANRDNEPFRYVCLRCEEEVFLAAPHSEFVSPHFKHRSGNNDIDCDLYLGQYGSDPVSHSIRNKRQGGAEFYYKSKNKAFYMSFIFSDAEITAYESTNSSLEVRTPQDPRPFFTKKINHENFLDETPEKFIIEKYSESYCISITSSKFKREYKLFNAIRPAFFKIQGEDTEFTAKYIKGINLYTNVKYFIVCVGKNAAKNLFGNNSSVKIDGSLQTLTMNNRTFSAIIVTFTTINPLLDAILCSWDYKLSTSEELALLWPPAHEHSEVLCVAKNTVFVYSSFILQAGGNTSASRSFMHEISNNITKIHINSLLKILEKNAEMTVAVTEFSTKKSSLDEQHLTETKFTVPKNGMFYYFSKRGVEKLYPGQKVFLTETSSIIEYDGNYKLKIITKSVSEEKTVSERMREALAYYWVSVPFDMEIDGNQSEDIMKYLIDSKNKGYINKALKTIIMEEENYE